jgi:imidazolonepropionase-like amidohydrolase
MFSSFNCEHEAEEIKMVAENTIFTGGTVFVGNGQILENASVEIEDGIIKKVVKGAINGPENAKTIGLSGCTLMPGLIDCHTHIALDGSNDPFANSMLEPLPVRILKAVRNAEKTLLSGVTTIRDMGGADGIDLDIRNAIQSGLIRGPRILASGRVICITGGHGWPIGQEADGPDGVMRAVRQQIKAGADLIKFMVTGGAMTPGSDPGAMQMTEEELEAGIREAHKAGRKTAAHAKGEEGIIKALLAGIDSIEHGTVLTEDAISWMVEKKIPVIFTLSALYNMERAGVKGGVPAHVLEKALFYKSRRQESIKMAKQAGVLIAMGTDAGTPFNLHGENLAELERLVEVGYSPVQALMAATSVAARLLGLEKDLGTIEEGKLADLVVVDGDPVQDINCLSSNKQAIKLIVKDGDLIFNDYTHN